MKKVVYAVTKLGKTNTKTTGVGYISDRDLLTPGLSKNGKPYIRVYQDCIKNCHKVKNKQDEFKGNFYEIHEVEFIDDNFKATTREIEVEYLIWFKLATLGESK